MSKKEYTLKEAATLLNKSDRTVRRYLDKLDNYDRNQYCRVVKGKILVNEQFIQFFKNDAAAPAPKKQVKKDTKKEERPGINIEQKKLLEIYEKENQYLKDLNLELRESIKDKDEQIRENIKDFKTLTNAVLHLQNEIKELGAAPAPSSQDVEQEDISSNSKTEYKLLTSSSVKIIISVSILLCIFLVLFICLKHLL